MSDTRHPTALGRLLGRTARIEASEIQAVVTAFLILGFFGREVYRQAPPIPERVDVRNLFPWCDRSLQAGNAAIACRSRAWKVDKASRPVVAQGEDPRSRRFRTAIVVASEWRAGRP